MAETTNTTTSTTTREPRGSQAGRSQADRSQEHARKSTRPHARPPRSTRTAAPLPSRRARRPAAAQRTIAKNETREAAQAQATAAKTTAAQGRNVAERAALVYVGATLEARDRVVGLATGIVDKFGTRTAAERELNKDIRRFERRGTTARNKLERDVRKARTRLERADPSQPPRVEREVNGRTNVVTAPRGRGAGRLATTHRASRRRQGARHRARVVPEFPPEPTESGHRVSLPASYSPAGFAGLIPRRRM